MQSETEELIRFANNMEFNSLPHDVVHETKRAIMDSIGCALCGTLVDKGRISINFARALGGSTEATILATGDKVSCAAAAFANAELINALDWDCMLFPAHVTPYVLSASLALGEYRRVSGNDLILAVALAHEISTRIGRALAEPLFDAIGNYQPQKVSGFSQATIGGAIGAAKIAELDEEKIRHAAGLAGHMASVPTLKKWRTTTPSGMDKYLSAGWTSMAEVTAVMLAEAGYAGDSAVLDGEYGFWSFFGAKRWQKQVLLNKLGEEWRCTEISYKPYPCCGMLNGPMDSFIEILEQNELKPDDIQSIRVLVTPQIDDPVWRQNKLDLQIEAGFHVAYIFSVLAHKIPYLDWYLPKTINNADVLAFMKKVSFDPHPDFGKAWLEDPRSNLSKLEVFAKGNTFKKEKSWHKGDFHLEIAKMTDKELEEKFRLCASKTIPADKIDFAVRALFELDKIDDISNLTLFLHPL